jgi:competence protein ComFC
LEGLSVGADYEGAVKELVLQLKFHRLKAATEAAAGLVLRCADEWPDVNLVTSVPVAAGRYRERGYNQSELLAREVARRLGLPYSTMLGRLTTAHQMGQDRRTRLEQVAGAFYGVRRLEGQRVLIVDDVVTTGATLSECAATLRAAGAGPVWAAAVARH